MSPTEAAKFGGAPGLVGAARDSHLLQVVASPEARVARDGGRGPVC